MASVKVNKSKIQPWTILAPHAALSFEACARSAQFESSITKLPGVRNNRGTWLVPDNLLRIVEEIRVQHNVTTTAAAWAEAPKADVTWESIEAKLKEKNEVREWVMEDFLLEYQKEAINFSWTKNGTHFWHPTGCLLSNTRVLYRKCLHGEVIDHGSLMMSELHRFFGQEENAEVTFQLLSVTDENKQFWNTVRATYNKGMKDVYLVRTDNGDVLEATLDHQFKIPRATMSPTGKEIQNTYVPLRQLNVESEIFTLKGANMVEEALDCKIIVSKIWGISYTGKKGTYDVLMESPNNNYVAEGFVVHNSGKTLTGIVAGLSVEGPMVIVTRAASRIQYAREVEKFTNLKAYVVRPSSTLKKSSQTLEQYLEACSGIQRPVVILGWESLTANMEALQSLRPGVVIYDEAHRGKNSKRWDKVNLADLPEDPDQAEKVRRADMADAKAKGGFIKEDEDGRKMLLPHESTASAAATLARLASKRILTTATPVKNRVNDLWAQLDIAEPNAWGSASCFQDRYCDRKPGVYGGYDASGESNIDELNARIKHVAHILDYQTTHRHLPSKRRQSYYVSPEDQCKPASGQASEFNKELKAAQQRGATAILEVKLAQSAAKKRKAVLGLIEDHVGSSHKVVVFTARKADCEALGADVNKIEGVKKDGVTVWTAHGEMSTVLRQTIVDDYMAHAGPCVLIATGQSFGESLNLQDTDAALFVMLPYDPGNLRQWEGRFCRHGQKRPVVIYYVIAEGTVDEHVAAILIDKLPAVEKIAKDTELAAASGILSGIDPNESSEAFAESILSSLDFG